MLIQRGFSYRAIYVQSKYGCVGLLDCGFGGARILPPQRTPSALQEMAAHQLSNRLVSLFRTSLLPRSLSLPLRRPLATTTRTAWSSPSRLFSISPFRPDSQAGSGIKATWQPAEGNDSKGPLKFDQTPRLFALLPSFCFNLDKD